MGDGETNDVVVTTMPTAVAVVGRCFLLDCLSIYAGIPVVGELVAGSGFRRFLWWFSVAAAHAALVGARVIWI